MANPEHLAILKKGVKVWNQWRKEKPLFIPDLREADLFGVDLFGADLLGVNLLGVNLLGAELSGADLRLANLRLADLSEADLREADLRKADLRKAGLREADLREADLRGANLSGINLTVVKNLRGADLSRADLHEADLSRVNLCGADLSEADLRQTDLREADLRGANLSGINLTVVKNLRGANLCGADLSEADLRQTDLSKAYLSEANLSAVNFYGAKLSHANLGSADLRRCEMIDSNLDGAVLTGAKIWESKRSGWSIKGVICEYVCFDREGTVMTEFEPGEFEKLYSEQTKIVVHYEDGLTQFEVTTLPALIKFIESKYPGSSLRLRTIGEDVGGASVTVAVDELGDTDLSVLQEDFEDYKERIREEVEREAELERMVLQGQVNLLTGIIERKMGDTININKQIGVVKAESSTVNQNINNNDLDDISKLISDILAVRSEIEKVLPPEKAEELNAAFEVIEEQAKAPEKNWEKLKKGAQAVKKVLDGVGDTAGKWMPIIEELSDLL